MVSFWKVGVAAFVLAEQTESMLAFTATRNGGRTILKNVWVPPHQTKNVWRRQMASVTEEAKAAESKETEDAYSKASMEDIVSLCKRRGFIFPSSEIYNGFAGFYDYGPLGCELKKNVKAGEELLVGSYHWPKPVEEARENPRGHRMSGAHAKLK